MSGSTDEVSGNMAQSKDIVSSNKAKSKDLSITIPSKQLMESAKKFNNGGLFATFERAVECNSAKNYTRIQIMQVVSGLDSTFSNIEGMRDVGKVIAETLKPLIMIPMSVDEPSQELNRIMTLFSVTPDQVRIIQASDEEIREKLESASQTAFRNVKFKKQNNYETRFYQLMVMAVYYPKKKTFDVHHAYVYCRDTSVWQWAISGNEKTKRMTALELEGTLLLGNSIAQHSRDDIILRVDHDDKVFAHHKAIMN